MDTPHTSAATTRVIERITNGFVVVLVAALSCGSAGCRDRGKPPSRRVVVYTALDRSFSEPILAAFERQTGIETLAVYDTESTKTVGLANRLRAERRRPRCDVFWSNEILNTILLAEEGLLRPTRPANASLYPEEMQAADGQWYGFAARARVLLVNTNQLAGREPPRSMFDLLEPAWKARIGIAKPIAGTTATHVACLFQVLGQERTTAYLRGLKDNQVRIESGNKSCAENVASGALTAAWTDTDDAIIEVEAGKPVTIVYPDDQPGGVGTLLIPNTLAAIKDSPNPLEAERLIDYLLSPEVEARLARGPSAQIPLNRTFKGSTRVRAFKNIVRMQVDFPAAARHWRAAQRFVQTEFLQSGGP